jgi:hypothetical protein
MAEETKSSNRVEIVKFPKLRPYAAKVGVLLPNGYEWQLDCPVSLLFSRDVVVELVPEPARNSNQQFQARVLGFPTATEAESMGLLLSLSFLWAAVSAKFALRLQYHTPIQCVVFDRTVGSGGFGQVT